MFEVPFPSEKFIEDYVAEYIDEHGHCPISLTRVDHLLRQFEIKGYGKPDLIKIRVDGRDVCVTILELKNEPLKEIHISQLARYMRGAQRFLMHYKRRGYVIRLLGELAGPCEPKASGDFVYLLSRLDAIKIYGLKLGMENGFEADEIPTSWYRNQEQWGAATEVVRQLSDQGLFVVPDMISPARHGLELVKP